MFRSTIGSGHPHLLDVVGIWWGEYIGYNYDPKRRATLTDFLRRQYGCGVFAAVGVCSVQNVGVAAGPLVGREHCVAGSTLVVYNDKEGYRDEDEERSGEREHGEQAGCVAWESDARDQGVEEGAQAECC